MTTATRTLLIPTQAFPGLFLPLSTAKARLTMSFLCAKVRSAAGSRSQVTSDHSARVQPSSPPGLEAPTPARSSRGRTARPSPQSEPYVLHYSETARPCLDPTLRSTSARTRGPRAAGRVGAARRPLAAVTAVPRRAQDWPLPQRRGMPGGGGARPDAGGKVEAEAQAAAAAAGDPSGRPQRGGLHGRRHSGDAAAGGAHGPDRGWRDHQSRSPPRSPRRGSGVRDQSARESRAGRRVGQCRAAL